MRVRRSALDGDAIAQDAGSSPRPSFAIAGRKLKGVHERSDSSRVEPGVSVVATQEVGFGRWNLGGDKWISQEPGALRALRTIAQLPPVWSGERASSGPSLERRSHWALRISHTSIIASNRIAIGANNTALMAFVSVSCARVVACSVLKLCTGSCEEAPKCSRVRYARKLRRRKLRAYSWI